MSLERIQELEAELDALCQSFEDWKYAWALISILTFVIGYILG